MFPYGNFLSIRHPVAVQYYRTVRIQVGVRYTVRQIGELVRKTRRNLGVTQRDLALTSGTGIRFIIDLERGKETCEIGKALTVLNTLGIKMTLTPPAAAAQEGSGDGPHA